MLFVSDLHVCHMNRMMDLTLPDFCIDTEDSMSMKKKSNYNGILGRQCLCPIFTAVLSLKYHKEPSLGCYLGMLTRKVQSIFTADFYLFVFLV